MKKFTHTVLVKDVIVPNLTPEYSAFTNSWSLKSLSAHSSRQSVCCTENLGPLNSAVSQSVVSGPSALAGSSSAVTIEYELFAKKKGPHKEGLLPYLSSVS